jgi:cysteinyl-tRNA synthetase
LPVGTRQTGGAASKATGESRMTYTRPAKFSTEELDKVLERFEFMEQNIASKRKQLRDAYEELHLQLKVYYSMNERLRRTLEEDVTISGPEREHLEKLIQEYDNNKENISAMGDIMRTILSIHTETEE